MQYIIESCPSPSGYQPVLSKTSMTLLGSLKQSICNKFDTLKP